MVLFLTHSSPLCWTTLNVKPSQEPNLFLEWNH
jgi:hypothetical protein